MEVRRVTTAARPKSPPFANDLARMEQALADRHYDRAIHLAKAVLAYETSHAIRDRATFGQAREGLGMAYMTIGRVSDAAVEFDRAVRHHPTGRAYAGLARTGWQTGGSRRMLTWIDQALTFEPNHPLYHVTRGEILLMLERWEEGFPECEHRLTYRWFRPPPNTPAWDGGSLDGRSICVTSEGGFGDAIQMTRYAPLLKARGAGTVLWHTHQTLLQLLRGMPGLDLVVPMAPTADCWVPLMSLPHRFGTTPETIPPPVLFPWAPATREARSRRRVGLVWAGSASTKSDPIRSVPVQLLEPVLAAHPELDLVVLQFGDAALAGHRLPSLQGAHWPTLDADWRATAAHVQDLDLMITVDTAMGHLAGTLGIPTFLLLAHPTDWRWLTRAQTATAWYPTHVLFRQPTPRDWASVLRGVHEALIFLASWRQ